MEPRAENWLQPARVIPPTRISLFPTHRPGFEARGIDTGARRVQLQHRGRGPADGQTDAERPPAFPDDRDQGRWRALLSRPARTGRDTGVGGQCARPMEASYSPSPSPRRIGLYTCLESPAGHRSAVLPPLHPPDGTSSKTLSWLAVRPRLKITICRRARVRQHPAPPRCPGPRADAHRLAGIIRDCRVKRPPRAAIPTASPLAALAPRTGG